MNATASKLFAAMVFVLGTSFQAYAATIITVTPGTDRCSDPDASEPCLLGTSLSVGFFKTFDSYMLGTYGAEALYERHLTKKATASLPAASWYTTHFTDGTDDDPSEKEEVGGPITHARIEWDGELDGGPFISSTPIYLLVSRVDLDSSKPKEVEEVEKTVADAPPDWYLFLVPEWDGKGDVTMEHFWPGEGDIVHVAIYGVPDGGSMAMLLGMALLGLAAVRRVLA